MPSKTPHPLWQHLRKFVDSPLGILLGASIYAIWAAYVNRGAGLWVAMRTGLGQLMISITLTYYGFRVMRAFYGQAQPWIAAPRALLGGLGVNYTLLFSIHHWLLHTPLIMPIFYATLLPTLLADSSYILLLIKTHNHPPADQPF